LRRSSWPSLAGPAAVTLACFALRAAMPEITRHLGPLADGWLLGAAAGLAGMGGWIALAWTGARLFDLLLLRAARTARRSAPYPRLLGDLVRVVLFTAAGVLITVQVFGQSALGLVATSGIVVAVVGFALRNIISDVFSGIVLGVDPPYHIGDWIDAGEGCAGRVEQVSWRTTRLVTRDGVAQVVPNGAIAARRIADYGPSGSRYRIALRVPLDPAVPPERAKRILLAGALDAGRSIPGLAPDVLLHDIDEGSAVYLVRFHVPDYGQENPCRDAVATAVLRALQRIGLGVARPSRDLRLERPRPAPARPRRAALIGSIDLFRGFPPEERSAIEERLQERILRKGDVLVRQGDEGASLFVVAEGALDVHLEEQDGSTVALDRMVPGDVAGEMSLLTGQPRSATVTAATDAVVYEVDRDQLDPILRRRPDLAERLAAVMADRRAKNAARGRKAAERRDEAAETAVREDLLDRLRAFFRLG
jgi:small-conductance mechanosensitive channel/CRP-like cAMP-binding protein